MSARTRRPGKPGIDRYEDPEGARDEAGRLGEEFGATTLRKKHALADDAPPHQAFEAQGRDHEARVSTDIVTQRQAYGETKAGSPVREQEHGRKAADYDEDRRGFDAKAEEEGALAQEASEKYRQLDPARQGGRHGRLLTAQVPGTSIVLETLVFTVVLKVVPGTEIQHWLTAATIGFLLALFADGLGWTMTKLWEVLAPRSRRWFWPTIGLVLIVLFCVLVYQTQEFRAEAFKRLANGEIVALDPRFFGPLQLLMGAIGSVVAFRYHLGAPGRRLLAEHAEHRKAQETFQGKSAAARTASRNETAAGGVEREKAARAEAGEHYLTMKEETMISAVRAHTQFVSRWFDTRFLARRYETPPAEPAPVDPALAAGRHQFLLRRGLNRALGGLAVLSVVAAIAALGFDRPWVAIVALAASLAQVAMWLILTRPAPAPDPFAVLDQRIRDQKPVVDATQNGASR